MFLEISQNPHENTSYLVKLQAWGLRLATLLKKVSDTGVFLRIVRIFQKHLFYRTPPDECFHKIRRLEDRFTGIIGDSAVNNSTIEGRVGTLVWPKYFWRIVTCRRFEEVTFENLRRIWMKRQQVMSNEKRLKSFTWTLTNETRVASKTNDNHNCKATLSSVRKLA